MQWQKVGTREKTQMCFCRLLCVRIKIDHVEPGSEITPCIKIDRPLVVERFSGYIMTSKKSCLHIDKIFTFLRKKWEFKVIFMAYDK